MRFAVEASPWAMLKLENWNLEIMRCELIDYHSSVVNRCCVRILFMHLREIRKGHSSWLGCASMQSTAAFPITRSCAPPFVSGKRMQCSFGLTHCRLRAKGFHSPKPCQQHEADRRQTGGVFPLCCGLAKHLPEPTELVGIQPRLPPFSRKLSNPLGWVSQDNLQAGGMTEKASQGSDRTARDAGATGCSPAPAVSAARRLAGRDVGLHPFDIVKREAAHHPRPEERLDVISGAGRRRGTPHAHWGAEVVGVALEKDALLLEALRILAAEGTRDGGGTAEFDGLRQFRLPPSG
jgi:hypothetical protein